MILVKHSRLIGVCALVAALIAFIVCLFLPPMFEAEAGVALVKTGIDLNFDPKFKTVSELDAASSLIDQTARRKALATIASSADIASAVIAQSGPQLPERLREPSALLRAINARSDGDMVRISARADSPELAALLANTWAQVYVKRVNAIYGDGPLTPAQMQTQADAARQTYDRAEAAVVAYLTTRPVGALLRTLQEKQNALDDSLAVGTRLDRMLADARALRDRLGANPADSSAGSELAKLILETNSYSAATNLPEGDKTNGSGPIVLQFQIDPGQLNTNPSQVVSQLDSLIATLTTRKQALVSADVTQLQNDVNQLHAQLEQEDAHLQVLKSARDLARNTYTTLATKVAELTVAEQAKSNVVQLAINAVPPVEPVEPRRVLYTFLGGLAGLVLGVMLAFAPEFNKRLSLLRAPL